ncbi:unnamed protein product [Pylaiella littoralis]
MVRLSYAWVAWLALVVTGSEASPGDRNWLYADCLDTCVEKACGITYTREDPGYELNRAQELQKGRLFDRLDQHLAMLPPFQQQQQQQQARQQAQPGPQRRRHLQRGHPDPPPETEETGSTIVGAAPGSRGRVGGGGVGVGGGGGGGDGSDGGWDTAVGSGASRAAGGKGEAAAAAGAGVGAGLGSGVGPAIGAGMKAPIAAADEFDWYAHQPPWYLRAMGWDCVSECRHTCMNLHVEARVASGDRMLQYYGKWPFRRIWGVQELLSSLFSLGNGLPHLFHAVFSAGQYNPPGHYMQFWLTIYPWVGMNTWLWSAVFHSRDVPWTEAADYFFALLNIFFVVWVALVRLAGPPRKRSPGLRKLVPAVGVLMSVYYLLHISFMWFVKFDYGYNMKVALLAGVAHTGLWLRYQYLSRDRPYARRGAAIIILLNAAILLEVNDFPPVYRLLDAHAIWHFVTIPLMFRWYRFVIQDARHEVSVSSKAT